jgi:hypothetical protein
MLDKELVIQPEALALFNQFIFSNPEFMIEELREPYHKRSEGIYQFFEEELDEPNHQDIKRLALTAGLGRQYFLSSDIMMQWIWEEIVLEHHSNPTHLFEKGSGYESKY